MATHNQVRIVGYLMKEPTIINEGMPGEEKFIVQVRTARRDIEGFMDRRFADLILFYDGTELMGRLKKLRRFDAVDVKGVFNILPTPKIHKCTECGCENTKYNTLSSFIYPQFLQRIASYKDYYETTSVMPNKLLEDNYKEVSNQCLIMGTVVSEPEFIRTKRGLSICRYCVGVNRKYYINTQNTMISDYPWVYSYGSQAEDDYRHLVKNESLVMIDSFVHNEHFKNKMVCGNCGQEFTYTDIGTQFTPYAVEYLCGYKTDEDIAREEENEKRRNLE